MYGNDTQFADFVAIFIREHFCVCGIDLFHGRGYHRPFEMVLIYQPPNAHVRISWILLHNAMAAVKKIIGIVALVNTQYDT
jgi:hypothetical protein